MVNFKLEDCKFFQDEKLGKTVALIENRELDAYMDFITEINKITNNNFPTDLSAVPEEIMLPNKIKAISTCHFPDNWDPEKGKRQAYYKLLRSYNKMKFRAINRLMDFFKKELLVVENLSGYYKRSSDRLSKVVKNPPEVKIK